MCVRVSAYNLVLVLTYLLTSVCVYVCVALVEPIQYK